MAYGQILGPQLDPEFDPEALRGLGAENRVLKVRTNSPFLFSFIYIKMFFRDNKPKIGFPRLEMPCPSPSMTNQTTHNF